jgi:trehalose 6-phosphate synthase
VGVHAAMRDRGGLWFGWSGEVAGTTGSVASTTREGITYATVDFTTAQYDRYYKGYCNTSLWPLFHYLTDRFRFDAVWHEAYRAVNLSMARALAPLLRPDDVVWVHDYHLIPFARCLRELGVTARVGFFLHIPFPHFEVLRLLPTCHELVHDLTAFDLVGLQTDADVRSFDASARHLLGDSATLPPVAAFPIGVDVEGVRRESDAAQSSEAVRRMVKGLLGRRLVIGVDRLDYSKGLVERFAAYQAFLERYPAWRGRLTYLQIAPLSREDVQAYAAIREALEQAAGRTNGRFADTDWTPIRYLNRNFPHGTLMGFLRAAQVGLVTPLRDGMNLVAKEYVAAQDPADPGVLVLSSLAGAACELEEAVVVNPHDPGSVADAIDLALHMPLAERQARHAAMLERLRRRSIHAWHRDFLSALESSGEANRK